MQRQVEAAQPFVEIGAHLFSRFAQKRHFVTHGFRSFAAHELRAGDAPLVSRDGKRDAERRGKDAPDGFHGYAGSMDEKKQTSADTPTPSERGEIKKEAEEAREGDKKLDDYDKAVADSFPASDPPVQP